MTTLAAPHRRDLLVGLLFATALVSLSWIRHRNGWTGGLDLGILDQGVWLLSQGRDLEVTLNGHHLFADHLSPVLLLFAPLYRLNATPVWLFVGQALSVGLGVAGLRRFALERGLPVCPATLAGVLSAPILAAALFDFHPSTMTVGPLSWLLVRLDNGTHRQVVLAGIAVLMCRADLGIVLVALAIVAPTACRRTLVILGTLGVGLGAIVPALFGEPSTFRVHYGHLGDSPADAVIHPWRVLTAITAADARTYFLWLLGGGLLCLRASRWAVAVLVAGAPVLLSQWPGTEDPYFHYGAPLAPVVIAGSLVALDEARPGARAWHLVAGAAVATLLAGPLSPKAPSALAYADVLRSRFNGELEEALAAVPDEEPVAAVNRVLPHISQRVEVYGFPIPFVDTDLSVLYGGADPEVADRIRVVIVDEEHRPQAEALGFELEDLGELLIGRRDT